MRSPERQARRLSRRASGMIRSAEGSPSVRATAHASIAPDLSAIVGPAIRSGFENLPPIHMHLAPNLYNETLLAPSQTIIQNLVPFQTTEVLKTLTPGLTTVVQTAAANIVAILSGKLTPTPTIEMSSELNNKISSAIESVLKTEIPKLAPQKIELNAQFETKLMLMMKKVFLEEAPKFAESVQKSMEQPMEHFIARVMRTESIKIMKEVGRIANEQSEETDVPVGDVAIQIAADIAAHSADAIAEEVDQFEGMDYGVDANALLDEPNALNLPAPAPAATTTPTVPVLPLLTQSASALQLSSKSKSALPLGSKSATSLPSIQLKKLSADASSITLSSDSVQQQESSMSIPGMEPEMVDYNMFLQENLGSASSLEAARTA